MTDSDECITYGVVRISFQFDKCFLVFEILTRGESHNQKWPSSCKNLPNSQRKNVTDFNFTPSFKYYNVSRHPVILAQLVDHRNIELQPDQHSGF